MSCKCSPLAPQGSSQHYFVVCMDYRSAGREAVVDPEITRADVLARLKSREYKDVSFIHEIVGDTVRDVTLEMIGEARGLVFA